MSTSPADPPAGPPTWHDVFEVGSYWADLSGHIYPHALLQAFQDSAWKHAEALGLGYSHLDRDSLLWVLSRLDIHITRLPEWGETMRLETWPTRTHRLFALREFCLYDDDERELLRANSAWLVLDGQARRPVKPQPVVEARNIPVNPGNYDDPPPKVQDVTSEPSGEYSLRVRYSDIDAQGHVNNARYLEWMLNAMADDWLLRYRPREISINFVKECRIGETLKVSYTPSSTEARERTRHAIYQDGAPVSLLSVAWDSR